MTNFRDQHFREGGSYYIETISLICRANQQSKSMDWFLYDTNLRHKRVRGQKPNISEIIALMYRSNRLQKFFKLSVSKNFVDFTGKHLNWSRF